MVKKLCFIEKDSSTIEAKIKKILKLGYLKRNRWEDTNRVCVLPNQQSYITTLVEPKELISSIQEYNEDNQKTIISDLYQGMEDPNVLYVISTHYNSTKNINMFEGDCFVSNYVLINSEEHNTTVKGGKTVKLLDFIQLSRFDPREEVVHVNDFSNISDEELDAWEYYFGYLAAAPHFHFASKQNAVNFRNSTKHAINIYDLINYIKDLINNDSKTKQTSFGMPYLYIKNNPKCYSTNITPKELELLRKSCSELLETEIGINNFNSDNFNKAQHSKKIIENLSNISQQQFFGLEAVYLDLWVLAKMLEEEGRGGKAALKLATKILTGGSCEQEMFRIKSKQQKKEYLNEKL